MVTYFTLAVSAYGAYWLALGGYQEMLVGALVLVLAVIGSHLVWISCLYHEKYIRVPNE